MAHDNEDSKSVLAISFTHDTLLALGTSVAADGSSVWGSSWVLNIAFY